MREQLLGYLLDALEPDECERLEDRLQRAPDLQQELELLSEALEPLRAADGPIQPPPGLAQRTCRMVDAYRTGHERRRPRDSAPAPMAPAPPCKAEARVAATDFGGMTLADMTVAAGIVVAAALLLFPAIQQSRASARLDRCRNNLRQIGAALAHYATHNHGYYPPIGPGETAGVYAVHLQQNGYMTGRGWNLCPASAHADANRDGYVPTYDELSSARGRARGRLQQGMGGGYGYTLHYVADGSYRCLKQQNRPTLAIMADAPSGRLHGLRSANHGVGGQNVLYDDGHVRHLSDCVATGCRDHIFLNNDGLIAPGTHADDAVIAPSAAGVRSIFSFFPARVPVR